MQKFNLDITLITPISDIPLKLNFFYKQTLCHEFWFMPWETAMSKTVSFPIHVLDDAFELNNLNVFTDDKNDILFESIVVNGQVQKLSSLTQTEKPSPQTVSALLKLDEKRYSVVKVSDLPNDVTISYGYNCNNSIYIPGCDISRATVHFGEQQKFSFRAELFKANVVEADKEYICSFELGKCMIEEKIKISSASQRNATDVLGLRNKIAEHYDTQTEQANTLIHHDAPIVDIQNAFNTDIDAIIEAIQSATQERFYSVIKLCGLPKNMFENNVFYNDRAYFLTKETVSDLKFKNIQRLKGKTDITVHFFGENTETPLKTLILHLENAKAETASIKTKNAPRAKKNQRKKSA